MRYCRIVLLTTALANLFFITPLYAATKDTTENDIVAKNTAQITPINDKEAPNKEKVKVYHVYDDVNLIAKIDFQYPKPRMMIKAVTPFLSSDVNDNNNVQYFNQAVMDIVSEETENFKQKVEQFADVQKKMPRKSVANRLTIDFDTASIDSGKNHIISVRFSLQGYISGLERPYHTHRVLNFDLDNNRTLEMSDLFKQDKDYIAVLSNLSNTVLARRLEDKERVAQGTAPTLDNFKNWNIKPYGILITFDENQVAPSNIGTQSVLIPYSKLKDILATDSPLSACLKHRRRCLSDNLLTGGFIDEV